MTSFYRACGNPTEHTRIRSLMPQLLWRPPKGALRFREKFAVRDWEGRRRRERYLGRRGLGRWLAVLACRHRGEAARSGGAGAHERAASAEPTRAEQQHSSAAEQAVQRRGGCGSLGAQPLRRDKGGRPDGEHDHQQQRCRQRTSDHRPAEWRRAEGDVASFPHHPLLPPSTTAGREERGAGTTNLCRA